MNTRRRSRPLTSLRRTRSSPLTTSTAASQDQTAWFAVVIATLSLATSLCQTYITYGQAERIAAQAGPVLDVKSALQLRPSDGGPPQHVTEEQHPTVDSTILATHASVDLVLTVTNIGREDTNLLGAELGLPDRGSGRTVGAPLVRCSNPGGVEVECSTALPYPLPPGARYYLTFPLGPQRDRLAVMGPGDALVADIEATGVPGGHSTFASGVRVDLAEPSRITSTRGSDETASPATSESRAEGTSDG